MSDEANVVSPAASPAPAPGVGERGARRADLVARARDAKARRGRPPARIDGPGAPAPDPGAGNPAGFSPDAVRAMVRLPFALGTATTGYTGLLLEKPEEDQLAASGSVVLNTWVRVDPRWAALAAFSVALVSVASVKAVGYALWRKEQEAARAAEEEAKKRAAEPPEAHAA